MQKSEYARPAIVDTVDVRDLFKDASGFASIICFEQGPPNPQCDITHQ